LSFILNKYWIDIGTPKKYLEVHHDILSGKFSSKRVGVAAWDRSALPADVTIDAKSIIDADVTIKSGARIENSVIGRNCKIEEGAQIIDSVIWAGNTLDAGSHVEGAILGKGCYVGRSVTVRPGVVLGDKTAATDFSQL
jgi:NDP-sugar pyrophosphorylase family protein